MSNHMSTTWMLLNINECAHWRFLDSYCVESWQLITCGQINQVTWTLPWQIPYRSFAKLATTLSICKVTKRSWQPPTALFLQIKTPHIQNFSCDRCMREDKHYKQKEHMQRINCSDDRLHVPQAAVKSFTTWFAEYWYSDRFSCGLHPPYIP